jgi:hypothetical protein
MPRRQNKTGTNLLSEGGNFTTQKVGSSHQQQQWRSIWCVLQTPVGSQPSRLLAASTMQERSWRYLLCGVAVLSVIPAWLC